MKIIRMEISITEGALSVLRGYQKEKGLSTLSEALDVFIKEKKKKSQLP